MCADWTRAVGRSGWFSCLCDVRPWGWWFCGYAGTFGPLRIRRLIRNHRENITQKSHMSCFLRTDGLFWADHNRARPDKWGGYKTFDIICKRSYLAGVTIHAPNWSGNGVGIVSYRKGIFLLSSPCRGRAIREDTKRYLDA